MMKRLINILLLLPILLSCSEVPTPSSESDGRLELTLSVGQTAECEVSTRAGVDNDEVLSKENSIVLASVFLFERGNDNPCVMKFVNHYATVVEKGKKYKVVVMLLKNEKDLLENGADQKTFEAYVVANEDMTAFKDIDNANITRRMIESMEIKNNFDNLDLLENFTMYGRGNIDKVAGRVGLSVTLRRRAIKISPFVRFKSNLAESVESVETRMLYAVKKARLHDEYIPEDKDYYSINYIKMNKDASATSYPYTGALPFYSYPKAAKVNQRRAELHTRVTWTDGSSTIFKSYASADKALTDNTHYKVYITINTKGDSSSPVIVDADGIEVADWSDIDDIEGGLGDGREEFLEVTDYEQAVHCRKPVTLGFVSSDKVDKAEITRVWYMPVDGIKGQSKELAGDDLNNFKQLYGSPEITNKVDASTGRYTGEVIFTPGDRAVEDLFDFCQYDVEIKLSVTNSRVGVAATSKVRIYSGVIVTPIETDRLSIFVDGWRFPLEKDLMENSASRYGTGYARCLRYIFYYYYLTESVETPYGYLFRTTNGYFRNENYPSKFDEGEYQGITDKMICIQSKNLKRLNELKPSRQTYIGDPRVPSGWSDTEIVPYAVKKDKMASNMSNLWTMAPNIKVAGDNNDYGKLISPMFMVSSKFAETMKLDNVWKGSSGSDGYSGDFNMDFETARKRAATYQENGYPAGRWRLPTVAELILIAKMQSDSEFVRRRLGGKLILTPERHYIVSDNRCFVYKGPHNFNFTGSSGGQKGYCRPVYDLWVWGSDAEADKYEYHVGIK